MPQAWKILLVFFLSSLDALAGPYGKFELKLDAANLNEEILVINIIPSFGKRIVKVQYMLDAIDDSEFKDQFKKAAIYRNLNNVVYFKIDRRYLHEGHYIIQVEIEHQKIKIFNWLNFFSMNDTERIFLKINLEKAPEM